MQLGGEHRERSDAARSSPARAVPDGASIRPVERDLIGLQSSAGNAAVARLIMGGGGGGGDPPPSGSNSAAAQADRQALRRGRHKVRGAFMTALDRYYAFTKTTEDSQREWTKHDRGKVTGPIAEMLGGVGLPPVESYTRAYQTIAKAKQAVHTPELDVAARKVEAADGIAHNVMGEWNDYLEGVAEGAATGAELAHLTGDAAFNIALTIAPYGRIAKLVGTGRVLGALRAIGLARVGAVINEARVAAYGKTIDAVRAVVKKFLGKLGAFFEGENLLWGTWKDYPKVTFQGKEYAQIGKRLFTRHAVDRMMPSQVAPAAGISGAGGRGISPNTVEWVIEHGAPTTFRTAQNIRRTNWVLGEIRVVTERKGKIVVSVVRTGS